MSPENDNPPTAGGAPAGLPFESPAAVSTRELTAMARRRPGPVTLQQRQGVWVHSFKCSVCDLEFVLFSWLPDRHRVGRTFCPECGQQTPMMHWLGQASDSPAFQSQGPGTEIFQMSPLLDGPMLEDSVFPADDRYDFPSAQGPGPRSTDPRGATP